MSNLFSAIGHFFSGGSAAPAPAPPPLPPVLANPPTPQPVAPMPDPYSPAVMEAGQAAMRRALGTRGRSSTILTRPQDRIATPGTGTLAAGTQAYGASTLGGH